MTTTREIRLFKEHLEKIERVIDSSLNPDDENKYSKFQDVDEKTITQIREICEQHDELIADAYLRFLLSDELVRRYK